MRRSLAFIASLTLAASAASARDLERLGALVTPAYTAMSIALMCARDDPHFLFSTSGPRGTIVHYAQHVKDEVIAGLAIVEAERVLKIAAGRARETARATLYRVAFPFDAEAAVRGVKAYCQNDGRSLVSATIAEHDSMHERFIAAIRAAHAD